MEPVLITINESVATVTLNAIEKHNAFNDEIIAKLTHIFDELSKNQNVRIMILEANGNTFCAGADLAWMRSMKDYSEQDNFHDSMALSDMLFKLYNLPQVTIAKIQGNAFGGGVGLIAACDIAISSDNAKFCLSEVKLGLIPAVISPYILQAIGHRQARRYCLSAEVIPAQTALEIGLCHEICASDGLTEACEKVCQSILNNGPNAMRKAKELLHSLAPIQLDQSTRESTATAIAKIRISDEGQAGLTAFLNKQKPSWLKTEKG